jgi:DNA-directed RNA polymerase specialized sigma24 family protein
VRRFGADCGADGSDASLCRLDDDAMAVAYDRHAGAVFAWARSRVEQYADLTAEDVARAWYSRRRCADPAGGAALPWLLGTAQQVRGDWLRTWLIARTCVPSHWHGPRCGDHPGGHLEQWARERRPGTVTAR